MLFIQLPDYVILCFFFIVTKHCFFVYDIWINATNIKDHVSFMVHNLHSIRTIKDRVKTIIDSKQYVLVIEISHL
jgi:hypothetical protein